MGGIYQHISTTCKASPKNGTCLPLEQNSVVTTSGRRKTLTSRTVIGITLRTVTQGQLLAIGRFRKTRLGLASWAGAQAVRQNVPTGLNELSSDSLSFQACKTKLCDHFSRRAKR